MAGIQEGSFICPTEKASSSLSAHCIALGRRLPSQAQDDRYRKTRHLPRRRSIPLRRRSLYKDGIYADDDFWYGDRAPRDQHAVPRHGPQPRRHHQPLGVARQQPLLPEPGLEQRRRAVRPRGAANAVRVRNTNTRADAVDRDRNGRIDRSEWMGSRNEFSRLDRNNDGFITHVRSPSPLSLESGGQSKGLARAVSLLFFGVTHCPLQMTARLAQPTRKSLNPQ